MNVDKERDTLFEYKRKFDPSYLEVGVKRPEMGGSNWKANGEMDCQIPSEGMNVAALSQRPFINLLHIPGMQERDCLTRMFYYCYITTTRRTNHYYPKIDYMKQKLLADERIHHAIQKTLCIMDKREENDEVEVKRDVILEHQLIQKASGMLDDILATVTSKALKFCGWLFLTILRQLTTSVHLHQGQLEVLRAISQEQKPIVYLPLHFSHFDYILLSLLLYHNEIRAPFVATGNNLNIPPFGFVMRRVGGFFIRRKIDTGNSKDLIYRAVLQSYVTELLRENQSLEVFIEGTRTRSGLPNQPKTGIFSIAVEAVLKGHVPDITLVPVCVSYEKIMEGTFDNELMGQRKERETFFASIRTIFRMLCGFYGNIRVNFGAPLSLKKSLDQIRSSPQCAFPLAQGDSMTRSKSLYEQVFLTRSSNLTEEANRSRSSPAVDLPLYASSNEPSARQHHHKMSKSSSCQLFEDSKQYQDDRELITLLAERMIYSCVKCKALMSTNLVSFLLLHHFREGVAMPVLVTAFRRLVTELLTRKSDIGFTGDFNEVVLHAIHLLGTQVVTLDCTTTSSPRSRASSIASGKSRRSADSGLEVDESSKETSSSATPSDEVETNSQASLADLSPASLPPSILHSNEATLPTGEFMAMTESGVYDEEQLIAYAGDESDQPSSVELSNLVEARYCRALAKRQRSKNGICLFVKPTLDIPNVFKLVYYANALTPIFAMESIAALAIGAATNFRFSVIQKQVGLLRHNSSSTIQLEVDEVSENIRRSFLRSSLVDRALELVDILQMDLILCDVTEDLEKFVNVAIDSLVSSGCLTSDEYGISAATKKSDVCRDLCFDAEDAEDNYDQWLKVNVPSVQLLIATQSVLASYVEGYVVTATQLPFLLKCNAPVSEAQFREKVVSVAQKRTCNGTALRAESCSSDVVSNAIRSFVWNGILCRCGTDKRSLKLSADFEDVESIGNLVDRISQFLL